VLRWLEVVSLDTLERLVLRSPPLQHFVLRAHERAFRRLLAHLPPVNRVTIVGGGLFPRTALVLQRLAPQARLTLLDADATNLECARPFVNGHVRYRHEFFDPAKSAVLPLPDVDLLVVPLSFRGDKAALYRKPPAPFVLVHDWLWNRRGTGVAISWPLLKRLNLVTRCAP
jgi:hypothetical protein